MHSPPIYLNKSIISIRKTFQRYNFDYIYKLLIINQNIKDFIISWVGQYDMEMKIRNSYIKYE